MQYFRSPRIRNDTVANIEELKKEREELKDLDTNFYVNMVATYFAERMALNITQNFSTSILLFENKTDVPFVTGDTPIINLTGTEMDKMTIFHYPISPRIAIQLIVTHKLSEMAEVNHNIHIPLNQEFVSIVKNCNQKLADNCVNEIYSNDDIMPLNETADKTEKAVAENVKDAVPGTNSLYVLNDKLEIIGSIHNLAKDETIYSARFMGDTGYFVTYRQVDPLFSVDLSDPENPKILGELKIPGFSEYLHPYGDGKLLGIGMDVSEDGFTTEGVKLSMFNVTDPSNVTEENKYTIEESYGTDVGYNYKGVFVDVQKNLFGFVTYHDGVTYQLYTYDEAEGFKEVMSRQLSGYEGSRGLYIGDVFYLVSGNMIESYSMNGFEKMDDIVL